jgi:hypothetical protein
MGTFDEYFEKYWNKLTILEKIQYKIVGLFLHIQVYFELFMYKVFKVDWHKNDEDEWEEESYEDSIREEINDENMKRD